MFLNDNTDYSVDISLINLYHLLFICNTLSYYLLFIFITYYHSNLLEDRTRSVPILIGMCLAFGNSQLQLQRIEIKIKLRLRLKFKLKFPFIK